MEKQEISPQRIASIFLTLPNNLYSPSVIPELMEYVKRLDIKTNPLLTSTALINFASLMERVCINHEKFNYSIPYALFGREDCGPSILKNLLPFLEEKAKSASKSHERAIYLQAINNLGSPEIIHVLKPYIYGKIDKNIYVRSVAIKGLNRLRLQDSARERVFETLMAVVENTEERSELRQVAFWTLLTWHPSASWWQRMAKSTWKEPSRNFATFITLTVESLAKATEPDLEHQAKIASFVLPLLKPFSPSLHSSYNRIYSRYDPESKIGVNFEYSMIESSDDGLPFEIRTYLRENYGDLFLQLFEVSVSSGNVGRSVTKILNLMRNNADAAKHENTNESDPLSRKLIESMSRSKTTNSERPYANIYLRTFENLYQYIPINSDVVSKVAGKDAENVLKDLLSGFQVQATKFYQPIDLEVFFPTEIGLPLSGKVSMPSINLGEADLKLVAPGLKNPTLTDLLKHHHLSLRFKSNYKFFSKLIVKLETLSPWNLKVAAAGVENYKEMNFPFYGDLSFTRSNEIKNVSLSFSPHTQQKFAAFHRHNVPFTMLRKVFPSNDLTTHYKVIGIEKDRKPALKIRKKPDQSYTGISSEMIYSGDVPYPFTSAFLLDYLRKPEEQGKLFSSPVLEQWQYSFSLDPSRSESKNITLAVSFVSTQESYDAKEEIPDFSAEDEPQERLQKLKKISESYKVYGLNTQLFLSSSVFRRYEVFVALTKGIRPVSPPEHTYRIVSAALASKIPGRFESSKALCLDVQTSTPAIFDLQYFKYVINDHPQEHLSSQIYYGSSCKSFQMAKAEGSLKLSDERQKLVSNELEKVCNHDPKDPNIELQTAAVYDVGTLDIDFSKENIPRSLLNATYSLQEFVEGALFPHGHYNNMHSGQPNKMRVEAKRPLWSKKYSFSVATPQKHSIFSEIQVPYFATKIVPFTGLETTYDKVTDSFLVSLDQTPTCKIRSNSIHTFDRVKYKFNAINGTSQCWSMAIKDMFKPPYFIIRIRQNAMGLQEAQVKSTDEKNHVEFTYKQVFINGKEMPPNKVKEVIKNDSGITIITVYKLKHGYHVKFAYAFSTFITSASEIKIIPLGAQMRNRVRGLCGDLDGHQDFDKTGPKDCLYRNDELFKYSWTTSEGDGCDQKQEEQMQVKVQNYQKTCKKRPNLNSELDYSVLYDDDDDCFEYIYPVRLVGFTWCAAYEHTHACRRGCSQIRAKITMVKAGCWPKGRAPLDVIRGETRGYITNPPEEKAPFSILLPVRDAKKCKEVKN